MQCVCHILMVKYIFALFLCLKGSSFTHKTLYFKCADIFWMFWPQISMNTKILLRSLSWDLKFRRINCWWLCHWSFINSIMIPFMQHPLMLLDFHLQGSSYQDLCRRRASQEFLMIRGGWAPWLAFWSLRL